MPQALSTRLREATRTLHTEVERSGLMRRLFQGRLSRAGYTALLRNLHALYGPLEAGLARHAGHPQIAALPWPQLRRCAALAQDLSALHGPGWAEDLPLQPAARAYARQLQAIAEEQPGLLAAHAYVRYLGDLNGGQRLAQLVGRGLGLAPDEAVAFYSFGSAESVRQLIADMRSGLDLDFAASSGPGLLISSAEAMVEEACSAFGRHAELFAQLERLEPEAADATGG